MCRARYIESHILRNLQSTTRQGDNTTFKTLKSNVNLNILKKAPVNWVPYLMFQACFMTSKMLQFCWKDCIVWAEINVKEQLSPLNEFTLFWRRENAESGVVYRTRTVFSHSLCFTWRIILFLKAAPSSTCSDVDPKFPFGNTPTLSALRHASHYLESMPDSL